MYSPPFFIQALALMTAVQFWWIVGIVLFFLGIFVLNQKGSSAKSSLSLVWVGLACLLVCLTTWIKWTEGVSLQVVVFIALSFAGVVVLCVLDFLMRGFMSCWHFNFGIAHQLPPYYPPKHGPDDDVLKCDHDLPCSRVSGGCSSCPNN